MTTPIRRVGDKVSVAHSKYPGVWTITSLGPANAKLLSDNALRRLTVTRTLLIDPVTTVTIPEFYEPGELIRIPEGRHAGLYVVIADKGGDKVNLAKLGGDGGAYL